MSPSLEHRPPQPFIALAAEVTHENLSQVVGGLFSELSAWIATHRVEPAGPPFVRYVFVDDDGGAPTRLQVAFPVAAETEGDERVTAGVLPGGRFAISLHTGPWSGLHNATAEMLEWGRTRDIAWAVSPDGKTWAARLEIYHTDPTAEPDPEKYRTTLAFLTAS